MLPNNNSVILQRLIRSAISAQESQAASERSMLYNISVDNDLVAILWREWSILNQKQTY